MEFHRQRQVGNLNRVKIGIVGVGGQGKKHLLNCLRLRNTEVVAIADSSKSALSKISKLRARTYLDYHEMIRKEKLDAVIIALPNYLHKDASILAAEAGCNILLEKPVARSFEEGKDISDCISKSGVKLMMGMCHRFLTDCQNLKKTVDMRTLGRIEFASALFFAGPFSGKKVPKWMFDPFKIGGGALLDNGFHIIDLLVWLFGDVRSVRGHTESMLNLDYEDYAEVFLRFKNGVNGLAIASWRSRIPYYRVEVVGEWGRRIASNPANVIDRGILRTALSFSKESLLQRIKGRRFLPLGDEIYYRELEYFVRCVLNDKEPKPDINDGLKVHKIIDSVQKLRRT